MKIITLMQLILMNFQGGTNTLDTNGGNVSIFGDNGTNKTKHVSGYTWLLFGSDSLGRTKFQIKNTNSKGEEAHREENSVEGIFKIVNVLQGEPAAYPETITLKKVHKERYAGKRGRAEEEFTGNTIDHFVNGVPATKKVFTDLVEKYFGDEERYRMISTPTAFPALPETRQRELLIEVGGGITDIEVIATDGKLSELPGLLGGKDVDERKKQVEGRQKEIKDKEKGLPSIRTRIDENTQNLPDISKLNKSQISSEKILLKTKMKEKNLQLSGIDNGGRIAELGKSLETAKVDIRAIETEHTDRHTESARQLSIRIESKKKDIKDVRDKQSYISKNIEDKNNDISILELDIVNLSKEWNDENDKKFHSDIETICFNCGKEIDKSLIEDNKNNALATFNRNKAKALQEIDLKRRIKADDIEQLKVDNNRLTTELSGLPDLAADEEIKKKLESDCEKWIEESGIYGDIPEWMALTDTIEKLELDITAERKGAVPDKVNIESEIEKLDIELTKQKGLLSLFDDHLKGMARIEELKDSEKVLNTEYEKLEKELFLINLFIHKKIELLDTKINGLFSHVRFKLFNEMNDGTLKPCCVFMGDGIPYGKGLNNAAELIGGLDICETLGKFYGILAPKWIDNAEAITQLPESDCQVIRLVVHRRCINDKCPHYHADLATHCRKHHIWANDLEKLCDFIPDRTLRVEHE